MRLRTSLLSLALLAAASTPGASGCGDNIELPISPTFGGSGTGGAGGAGTGGDPIFSAAGGSMSTSTGGPDLCVGVMCEVGQKCVETDGKSACVNVTCEELNCPPTQECIPTPSGGRICDDCSSDFDCKPEEHCKGTICVDDVCEQGTTWCTGQEVHECVPNGSEEIIKYSCGSPSSYFTSTCTDPPNEDAFCPCEDDWDCPAFTVCEVGKCIGTGKTPTCTLPPEKFTDVLANEIQWGGKGVGDKNANQSPFAASSQSSMTPLVANLDDDNGDGAINELDFPEIIFMTYCNQEITANGVARAIHGGGPNKGKDYFASCGDTIWHEGESIQTASCACSTARGNSTGAMAVGDLDYDGIPEIVFPTETGAIATEPNGLQILDNRGNPITLATNLWTGFSNPAVAIANLDNQGFAEIIVGNAVFTLEHDANGKLKILDKFIGTLMAGKQGEGPVSCVGNVAGDSRLEIIGGTTTYALPTPPAGVTKIADCPVGAMDDFCQGKLSLVWDGQIVNGATLPSAQADGFCAIADVLGADEMAAPGPGNMPDGKPEIVLISEGFLVILNGESGTLRRFTDLTGGIDGGAPNVDDFDGDGFPEIGTALSSKYLMIDLQDTSAECPAWPNTFVDIEPSDPTNLQGNPPRNPGGACTMDSQCASGAVCNKTLGTCVCLHNGWGRVTEDDSSRVTSSSVFDFNGDGAAEVAYNDECDFRIYEGLNGNPLIKQFNPSRTRIENPVIADVDNDGNAEIVFVSNNEIVYCSKGVDAPNGIEVWGDPKDTWVSARRIWNEHAYHVTNVTESGHIPLKEPESWKTFNGRSYNTYRSNPRSFGVAPDLTVKGVQITSPDKKCGELSTTLNITVQIDNTGDLRVGPGVVVTFYGEWSNPSLIEPLYANMMQTPLTATIQTSIEPSGSISLTVPYNAALNTPGTLPDKIRVVVDEINKEHECQEGNNELTRAVEAGMPLADLRILLGLASGLTCPKPTVQATLYNDGAVAASNIKVRFYAGDPNQGGLPFYTQTVPGPIPSGGNQMFTASLENFPQGLAILVYAIVDPDNEIAECNDGNNKDAAENKISCGPG
jgi:hypothetical protein